MKKKLLILFLIIILVYLFLVTFQIISLQTYPSLIAISLSTFIIPADSANIRARFHAYLFPRSRAWNTSHV